MDKHPDPTLLTSFERGKLSRRRNREVVRHLLAQCESCCRMIAAWSLPPWRARRGNGAAWRDYGAAFSQAWRETERQQAALIAEKAEAPELLRELLAQPADRQWHLASAGSRYHTWGLCELLLDAAREWGFQEPSRAVALSRLGVEIATRLGAARYGEARVNDLQARAWAGLGNAQRIRSDFRQAEESFLEAERLLRQGTGDPLEKAQVLLLKSSLRGNQRRFREAFRLLDRAVAIGRRCGDGQLCGKALIMKGFLTDSGRHDEALRLLESARPLYHRVGDQMGLLRLRWLEGKIALAAGNFAAAEDTLCGVRKELIERELGFDAALLSLELAGIYARQRRNDEVRRLAEEMIPMFQSRDIHREAVAALLVFHKAAEMELVTSKLIRDVSNYLQESRTPRGLRSRELR